MTCKKQTPLFEYSHCNRIRDCSASQKLRVMSIHPEYSVMLWMLSECLVSVDPFDQHEKLA